MAFNENATGSGGVQSILIQELHAPGRKKTEPWYNKYITQATAIYLGNIYFASAFLKMQIAQTCKINILQSKNTDFMNMQNKYFLKKPYLFAIYLFTGFDNIFLKYFYFYRR